MLSLCDQIKSCIDTAVQNKAWLILTFHAVDRTGRDYSITPENLKSIVNYLKQNNIKVVTVSQGLAQVNN